MFISTHAFTKQLNLCLLSVHLSFFILLPQLLNGLGPWDKGKVKLVGF